MFILTIHGKEEEGAYSVRNEEGHHVLYLFEEEDDAVRYAMMLEDKGYPEMHVIEVQQYNQGILSCPYLLLHLFPLI